MVVVSSPPTQVYEVFTKKVREYNAKKPFNFTTPELLKKFEKVFSIAALSLFLLFLFPPRLFIPLSCQAVKQFANGAAFVTRLISIPVCVHSRGVSVRFRQAVRKGLGPASAGSTESIADGGRQQRHPDNRDDYQESYISK